MTLNLTKEEARAILSKPKRSKFGNEKCEYKGIKFDSKRERAYYIELERREQLGEVSGIKLQHEYKIIVAGAVVGKYISDFNFLDHTQDCRLRVIDVKGHDTPLSRFKRKCVEAFYQIKVEVVK